MVLRHYAIFFIDIQINVHESTTTKGYLHSSIYNIENPTITTTTCLFLRLPIIDYFNNRPTTRIILSNYTRSVVVNFIEITVHIQTGCE